MNEVQNDIEWNQLEGPQPHVVVGGAVFHKPSRSLIMMHRSSLVRSAKDAWSLVTGCHEIGVPLEEQFKIEMEEELGYKGALESFELLDVYENITLKDKYHWTLVFYMCAVDHKFQLQNLEPEKHDEIRWVHIDNLFSMLNNTNQKWTPGLKEMLTKNFNKLKEYSMKL